MKVSILTLFIAFLFGSFANAQEIDAAVTEKIGQMLAKKYPTTPEGDRNFIYSTVDLNDDRKPEYLVGLTGSTFCGSAGCVMLVLNNKFAVNTRMSIVQFPAYVGSPGGKEVTKGYKNIYVSTKGVGYVKMAWNGSKYPTNPSLAPKISNSVIADKFAFLNEQNQAVYNF